MKLAELSLDLMAAHEGRTPLTQQVNHISPADLQSLTAEVYDRIVELLSGVNDVTYVPARAAADGGDEWNLAHVIVHLTAGLEENSCLASILARGAEVTGRARSETAWDTVHSRDQIDQRLVESRRITNGYLCAWPDQPNLTLEHTHGWFGQVNAVAYHILGINHAASHLEQIAALVGETP